MPQRLGVKNGFASKDHFFCLSCISIVGWLLLGCSVVLFGVTVDANVINYPQIDFKFFQLRVFADGFVQLFSVANALKQLENSSLNSQSCECAQLGCIVANKCNCCAHSFGQKRIMLALYQWWRHVFIIDTNANKIDTKAPNVLITSGTCLMLLESRNVPFLDFWSIISIHAYT